MRVLLVIDNLTTGGKERRFVELLKGLSSSGEVECEAVILSSPVHYEEVFDLGIEVHVLERKWKKDPRIVGKLFRIARGFGPDIVHSFGSMSSVYSLPLVVVFRLAFVNAMITNAPPALSFFGSPWLRSKLTFPFSDAVVANSRAGLRSYRAPRARSHCIHNGLDFGRLADLVDPVEMKMSLKIATARVVGMVGGFTEKKDYRTYLMAAKTIAARRTDVTFLAVGHGDELEACRRLVEGEYRDRILFTGLRKDVMSIVNAFDIGVLATYSEGFSNSIMEYMGLGKPVVATDGGGTSELVVNERTGFLVKQGSVTELVGRIEYLLSHPVEAETMGKAGRSRVREQFSLERMTRATVSLYGTLLRARTGAAPSQ